MSECRCASAIHEPKRIVLTGGPGAGKTAVLEVVRRSFCAHVTVLPEAATILFGGGFPRRPSDPGRCAAQRAIFHVQRELERMADEEGRAALVVCDRGTLDALAYWPGPPDALLREVATTRETELARYAAVIHLHTPQARSGYNHQNPVRTETAEEARVIDARIMAVWSEHPRRFLVDNELDFADKLASALALIRAEVPACCR